MVATPLADLDELVLTVRDPNSRVYIAEAVQAYRSGLNRAAVILTWTALAYDCIAKYREIADHGEGTAVKFVADLDAAIAKQNVMQLQQIESNLLDQAHDAFELIDDREKGALERLKEDRNHCAHPAFTGDSLLFSPSPELVRTHIVHSVRFVLQHAPLQGKGAFTRLKTDLLQASFPVEQEQATAYLKTRYYTRLKPSLIGKLITILIKEVVVRPDPDLANVPENVVRALLATSTIHAKEYELGLRADLPKFASAANDEQLWRVFALLGRDPRVWAWLDHPTQIRLENLVKGKVPADCVPMLAYVSAVPNLAPVVEERFKALEDDRKEGFIAACPLPFMVDDAIRLFGDSGTYRGAEARAPESHHSSCATHDCGSDRACLGSCRQQRADLECDRSTANRAAVLPVNKNSPQ